MTQRFYPAVLERAAGDVFAVWFPDFPGCVAAGADQQQAMAKAQEALARAVEALAERDAAIPAPTPFEAVETPDDAEVVAVFAMAATLPNPSERVNVYLPKSLIERMDRQAEAFGMSRSSLVGFAVTRTLDTGLWAGAIPAMERRKRAGK
ncbi:MAG: type II toxin-antitoxin system HicB family antitoxin [Caulobacterales bacterium]|jgi:predicted RNase H-like HicB family nuclease